MGIFDSLFKAKPEPASTITPSRDEFLQYVGSYIQDRMNAPYIISTKEADRSLLTEGTSSGLIKDQIFGLAYDTNMLINRCELFVPMVFGGRVAIDDTDQKKANDEHIRAYNIYSKYEFVDTGPKIQPVSPRFDLSELNLSNSDLEFVTFVDVNLNGANLSDCNLKYTNFIDCDLRNVNFSNSDMRWSAIFGSNCDIYSSRALEGIRTAAGNRKQAADHWDKILAKGSEYQTPLFENSDTQGMWLKVPQLGDLSTDLLRAKERLYPSPSFTKWSKENNYSFRGYYFKSYSRGTFDTDQYNYRTALTEHYKNTIIKIDIKLDTLAKDQLEQGVDNHQDIRRVGWRLI